jgi:methyl-accepting chemotaxis protein
MKSTNSIKFRLILTFSILTIVSNLSIGFISSRITAGLVTDDAKRQAEKMANEGAKLVESRIQTPIVYLETLAIQDEIRSMNLEQAVKYLSYCKEQSDFMELAIVTPDGMAYYTDGTSTQLGDRAYILRAFSGVPNVSDVIISRVINEPVVMVAVPIKDGNKVKGVLIGRRDANTLSELTKDIKHGSAGISYIISSTGMIMAHDDKNMVMDQLNPIDKMIEDPLYSYWGEALKTIIEQKNGFIRHKDITAAKGNEIRFAGFASIPGTDWIFISSASESELLNSVANIRSNMQKLIFSFLTVNIVIVYFVGKAIAKPIIGITRLTEKLALLDISINIPEKLLKKKDETGILAKSMQSIIDNLRNILGEITDSSLQVASTAQELTATAEQSASAADEVSKAVEDIAKGASEQAENTELGSQSAIKLGDIIDLNKTFMQDMNNAADKVTDVVKEGLTKVERLAAISNKNKIVSQEVYEIIKQTSDSATKIGEASNVIANIAKKTNLLALNASIEAVRAGEAGKGFSVVATEIKQLAEQSAVSTNYINDILSELQSNVSRAVESINNVNEISREQLESANSTKSRYESINSATLETEAAIDKLIASEEEIVKAKNEILDMLQNLSAIAEENAAGTQQASSAMLEQSTSMEELAKTSERLASLAANLQTIISKFKLS